MIRLIQWLIFGHVHIWEHEDELDIVETRGGIPLGRAYVCKCKTCGEPRLFRCK